jgi:Ca-activated chloride channel family protein
MSASLLFLRPWWLLALLLLPLWFWWQRRRVSQGGSWRMAVDAHLLPHLLAQGATGDQRWRGVLPLLAAALGIVALAGPSWRQTQAPLWQTEAPLVVALDLSSAMRTADLPPNRLTQAKARLRALFEQRRGGQTGLLVYAGDAFAVAPITRDGQTLIALLDSLQPDIMPADGQRMDRALEEAQRMLQDAGFVRGDILLVSNQDDGTGALSARRAQTAGFVTSVLGVGTPAGAPLADADGFVSGPDGRLELSRLDADSLRRLAGAGGGRYAELQADGSDLRALDLLDAQGGARELGTTGADQGLQRSDDGYWLILPVLALALLLFRRGAAVLVLLGSVGGAAVLHSTPTWAQTPDAAPAAAAPQTTSTWQSLWQRADQRARAALDAGDARGARELAQDPALQAAAAYRAEDFEAAAQAWSALPDTDADAHYNRGNALARAGKLKEALAAYDQALRHAPQMEDAIANRKAVEEFLRRQQQQQGQQGQPSGEQGEQDRQDQQRQDQQKQQSGDPSQASDDAAGQEGDSSDPQSAQSGEKNAEGEANDAQQDGAGEQDAQSSDPAQSSAADKSEAPRDAQSEAQAQAAMSEQIKDALEQEEEQRAQQQAQAAAGEEAADEQAAPAPALSAEERAELEKSQALQQWLRRVPDDPGSLLRRKFAREYQQRQRQSPPQDVP